MSGRNLAAWIGLVPKQHSTGGKERLGGISKQGNRYLRWLLVAGAMAVIRYARQHGTKWLWLARIMERRPIKVAAVALANKIARMAWARMPRATARCEDAPRVQFSGDRADAGDALVAKVVHYSPPISRAMLSVRFHRCNSPGVAHLLATERTRAIGVAELNSTGLGGRKRGLGALVPPRDL